MTPSPPESQPSPMQSLPVTAELFAHEDLAPVSSVPAPSHSVKPFKGQLLKWVGNKQRFAHEIISYFPKSYGTYFEPFLGSGAVLGTLAPTNAVGSDVFEPLMQIWHALKYEPTTLIDWYKNRHELISNNKEEVYSTVLDSYNKNPNGADFVFLTRTCYGGVVRFRKNDGYMSTPCGPHKPMPPEKFAMRVREWHERTHHVQFIHQDYKSAFQAAKAGDLIYCDPPYSHSQAILYGAQDFSLQELFDMIAHAKKRGVYVALSIDGSKQTNDCLLHLNIPHGVFEEEAYVNCGRSMLKRFQMEGETLENHIVTDRLLLTY
ncbi:DNA adenine methylase [Burkholderia ubonensis]|uniref:DNA adenine methylase n=1 Tax=Burkholderia ubonensis TaxID=101571 RepID=UPI001FC7E5C4|nr:Dam family site-specific DNA-(adenine-N6)-methyltransferase [Burkholderia ubonensis]